MDKQTEYDLFMVNVREMIYKKDTTPVILKQIQSTEKGIAFGIGFTAAMIIKSIKGGFELKKKSVSADVAKTAFMETVADLTELAISAGFVEEDQKKQIASQALKEGASVYQRSLKTPKKQPGIVDQQMEAA